MPRKPNQKGINRVSARLSKAEAKARRLFKTLKRVDEDRVKRGFAPKRGPKPGGLRQHTRTLTRGLFDGDLANKRSWVRWHDPDKEVTFD